MVSKAHWVFIEALTASILLVLAVVLGASTVQDGCAVLAAIFAGTLLSHLASEVFSYRTTMEPDAQRVRAPRDNGVVTDLHIAPTVVDLAARYAALPTEDRNPHLPIDGNDTGVLVGRSAELIGHHLRMWQEQEVANLTLSEAVMVADIITAVVRHNDRLTAWAAVIETERAERHRLTVQAEQERLAEVERRKATAALQRAEADRLTLEALDAAERLRATAEPSTPSRHHTKGEPW